MTDVMRRATVAERAARAGGEAAREQFRETLAVETKADKNDLVTEADRGAQQAVLAAIHEEYPSETLVCEEEAVPPGLRSGDRTVELTKTVPDSGDGWIVDPIDGTSNYVRGIRFWATSVAAISDGHPIAGTTYMPSEGDIYAAGSEGATRNGSAIEVSDRADPETFAVGLLGWWPTRQSKTYASLFRAAAGAFGDLRRMGSMQGVLALVASGGLDAAFMPETPHPWDAVVGVHLIRQAGGTVTDIAGDPWRYDSQGLVVSNGQAHDLVVSTVADAAGTQAGD